MQHDEKQLHQIAQDYPWYMFTVEEIAVLCNVSRDVVTRVRAAADSPFFLNKCRPEWFIRWMRNHPEFQLTKVPPPGNETGSPSCKNCEDPAAPLKKIKRRRSLTYTKPASNRSTIR
jgi:hypothetical protein